MNVNKFRANRKYKLMMKDLTENKLAVMLGVSRQCINKEISGIKTSKRLREAICRLVGVPEHKFFPEYNKEGNDAGRIDRQ